MVDGLSLLAYPVLIQIVDGVDLDSDVDSFSDNCYTSLSFSYSLNIAVRVHAKQTLGNMSAVISCACCWSIYIQDFGIYLHKNILNRLLEYISTS